MNIFSTLNVLREMTPDDFGFDYAQRVPIVSIVFMILGMILAIAVPVFAFIWLKRRYKLEPTVALYSLVAYMLGGYLLPNVLGIGLQWIDLQTGIFSANEIVYYLLISLLSAGLMILSIWLGMKMLCTRGPVTFGSSLLFGVCLLIVPLCTQTITTLGNYVAVSQTVNNGGLYDVINTMITESGSTEEEVAGLLDAIQFLVDGETIYYLMVALDVLLLMPIHISACVIYGGIAGKQLPKTYGKFVFIIEGLYAAAMFVRYIGVINSVYLSELLYLTVAVISVMTTYRIAKQTMPDQLAKLFGKPDPVLTGKAEENPHKMPKIVMPKD